MIFKRTKKGNALLIAIITLAVLGMLGLSHVLTSQMGRKRSAVLFQGIDANFLLEGIIAQTENFIRTQANDYSGKPEWFNKLRTTAIGSDSGWVEVNVSNMAINNLAKQVNAEIKARARFHATDVHRRDNKKTEASVNYGLEKVGQLEIMAQAKVNDAYYIGHAAKDVKIVNPLALSYDGQYNELNSYTMFIKYAMQEYKASPKSRPNSEGESAESDGLPRHGNIFYNRLMDDSGNKYYYLRLHNGDDSAKGKVYMGSHTIDRSKQDNRMLVDLPRGGYGNFYSPVYDKKIYELKTNGTHDLKAKFRKYGKSKVKTVYTAQLAKGKDYYLMLSMFGEKTLMEVYDNLIKQLKEAVKKNIRNQPDKAGRLQIGAGELIKATEPAVFRSIDGWEYATFPWSVDVHDGNPGYAKLQNGRILVNNPEDIDEFQYIGMLPFRFFEYDNNPSRPIMLSRLKTIMDSNKAQYGKKDEEDSGESEEDKVKKSETFPQFINAFTYNIYLNEVYPYYNSISHSSFINNNNLINGHRNGNDGDGGMRAHPVLQLRGKWVDNKFTSDTEVEGYVYGRYMDSYYTKMKRGEKVEVSDTDFVDDISDEEINNPNYDPDAEPDPDDPDNVNDEHEYADSSINIDSDGFENTKFIYTEGPKIRLQHADDYNSKAVYTPYNRTGIKYPVSLNTLDPDFANIYLDKITAVYIDYIDFAHNCIKIDGDAMTIYLNGIYLINSAFPIPISDNIKTVKYVGKGALLVSGDIAIKTDIKAADNHSFLILATVGRRHDNELKNSTIFVQGDGENALDIQASLVALNRDYPRAGGTNKNMGLSLPNFIMLSYGTKITGNWVADHLFYYPQGMDSSTPNKIKGTNLIYDKRLSNRNASDLNFYLADIGLPYAFFHVGRQTTSEF